MSWTYDCGIPVEDEPPEGDTDLDPIAFWIFSHTPDANMHSAIRAYRHAYGACLQQLGNRNRDPVRFLYGWRGNQGIYIRCYLHITESDGELGRSLISGEIEISGIVITANEVLVRDIPESVKGSLQATQDLTSIIDFPALEGRKINSIEEGDASGSCRIVLEPVPVRDWDEYLQERGFA